MPRGKYIVFEGADGTGKTTLLACLTTKLQGKPIKVRRFPSDGEIGHVIRDGLHGIRSIENKPFMYLYAADGLQENIAMQDELERGLTILCDRHPIISGEAYQPEYHADWQIGAVYGAAKKELLEPDALFVLDLPAELMVKRTTTRNKLVDIVFEPNELRQATIVRHRYRMIADRYGATLLDADRPVDEIADQVIDIAKL